MGMNEKEHNVLRKENSDVSELANLYNFARNLFATVVSTSTAL